MGLCSHFPNWRNIPDLPASWRALSMRGDEPWFSPGLGWIGAACPASSLQALFVDGLRGCAKVFGLLGPSALAVRRGFVQLCSGMAVWVSAVVRHADGKSSVLAEDYLQEDAAYVEPISLDYYNCASFFRPPNEKEEDSHSYQNVVIEVSHSSDSDDAVDYENSTAIHVWELQQVEALQRESPDDEPDYVNTAPVSGSDILSMQSLKKSFAVL
uniref:Uncharacterized protein n=1 Tax=Falco tinnunculus TaxID=100819 RepID=A0A8C4UMF1_FALTI